ncbi:MAG: undecaprenyl-phosphate glucose phosphotransferase [Pseudomonadota bacterium]
MSVTATTPEELAAFDLASAANKRGHSRRVAADIVGFFDMLAVVIGGLVPAYIYQMSGTGTPGGLLGSLQMSLVVAVIVYGCLRNAHMYDLAKMHDFPVRTGTLLGAMAIAFLAVLGIGLPFAAQEPHLWIWYSVWMSSSFFMLYANRIAANAILKSMTARGAFDTRVALYGTGMIADRLETFLRDGSLGIHFVGVFDDRIDEKRAAQSGPSSIGKLADLITKGRAGLIDQIIIALPQSADQRTQQIARKLEQLPVSLHVCTHIASDLVEEGPAHAVSNLGPIGLLDVKRKPLSDWAPFVKAVEDYVLASLMLVLLAPVLALIALAIKIDSGSPILFRQRRRGLNQKVIQVLKFRTMHVLEDDGAIQQATKNDPRVTRVGRFLRMTSLDELPQLINVLRGEMSLVGPRPHAISHDDEFNHALDRYANRHQVKPGITGLAQVSGLRGETQTPEKIEARVAADLDYINRWSLWLDLQILARTGWAALTGRNAY